MSNPSSDITAFLERFFGPGNELQWARIRPGGLSRTQSEALEPFLKLVTRDWERIILPRVRTGAPGPSWYACARDSRAGRILKEELMAFVGPSYSNFHGQKAMLDRHDPVEKAILEHVGSAGAEVFRLDVVNPSEKDDCRVALLQLIELWQKKPKAVRAVPRPPGRVIRDFELAVQNRSAEAARRYLSELNQHGAVSNRNLKFLEVHFYGAFGDWQRLDQILENGAIVQAQRPTRVTQALINAVYRRELSTFEQANQPSEALAHFRSKVLPQFGGLYHSFAGLTGAEATKSFLLVTAATDTPSAERRDFLLEQYPASALDRPYVEALARLIPNVSIQAQVLTPFEQARELFGRGDIDSALFLLLDLEPTVPALELMLRCALEMESLEANLQVLRKFDQADSKMLGEIHANPRLKRNLLELRSRYSPVGDPGKAASGTSILSAIPSNWVDWIGLVKRSPQWDAGVDVARVGATEWPTDELMSSAQSMTVLAEGIRDALNGDSAEILTEATPHLIHFFVQRIDASPAVVPILRALLDGLIFTETRSIESIRSSGLLLQRLIESGLSQAECAMALIDVLDAWKERQAFELLEWALDLFEALIVTQSVNTETLLRFGSEIRKELLRWRERISRSQFVLFEQLCGEADFADSLTAMGADLRLSPNSESASLRGALAGKSIALYSLRVESIQRVEQVLSHADIAAHVRIYADTVGTAALKAAARNADIFLIVTGAAKHAATEFIEANRPVDKLTLRCQSTGSASILRLLESVQL